MVLDEEAVDGNAITVDDEAVAAEVLVPADIVAVVGAPDPGVIDDHVVAVDREVALGAAFARATDTEEDVEESRWALWREKLCCWCDGPTSSSTGEVLWACVEEQAGVMVRPSTSAVVMAGGAGGGMQCGEAEAEDDGVRTRDADGFGEVVDAGRQQQVFAARELGVDGGGGVDVGCADVGNDGWESGMPMSPGVEPLKTR